MYAASIQKYLETTCSRIRIEINARKLHFIMVLRRAGHLCRYLSPLLSLWGKTIRHTCKWPARGKTMIKWSIRDFFLKFEDGIFTDTPT